MKKHILCLGDSNTHGYCADPNDCADHGIRFNEQERWTKLLQEKLGSEYLVIEEGLSGRTTVFHDPLYEGLAAIDYLQPCLKSHEMIDLLVIMLGTNDSKDRFSQNARCIALGMDRLVKKAVSVTDCWKNGKPNILVIAPPPIKDGILTCPVVNEIGLKSPEISRQLAKEYEIICEQNGIHFLDAGSCEFNDVDYMHLTKKGHTELASILGELVPSLVP